MPTVFEQVLHRASPEQKAQLSKALGFQASRGKALAAAGDDPADNRKAARNLELLETLLRG